MRDREYEDNRDVPELPPFGGPQEPEILTRGGDGDGPSGDPGDVFNPGGTGETPRERLPGETPSPRPPGGGGGGGIPGLDLGGDSGHDDGSHAAPPVPRSPHPAQASAMMGTSAPSGVQPYPPMGGGIGHPGGGSSRLFGSLGGLKGGGLGSPSTAFNPNDPGQTAISKLMAILQKKNGLF